MTTGRTEIIFKMDLNYRSFDLISIDRYQRERGGRERFLVFRFLEYFNIGEGYICLVIFKEDFQFERYLDLIQDRISLHKCHTCNRIQHKEIRR